MPLPLRVTNSITFSLVRRVSVPTNTLGFGSTNRRLSMPRMAGGVSLAMMTVILLPKGDDL